MVIMEKQNIKDKAIELLETIFVTLLWLMILPLAFICSLFEKKEKK